jgi:hypothetical protein
MPANPQALVAAGQKSAADKLIRDGKAANVVLMGNDTKLNFLGDYIVLPILGNFGSAYSIGDLVALAGEAALVFGMVRAREVVQPASMDGKGTRNSNES